MAGSSRGSSSRSSPSGPAPSSPAHRLGIRDGMRVAAVSTPDGFVDTLQLPPGVVLRRQARGRLDVVVFFATRRSELIRRLPGFARSVAQGGAVWLACPAKKSRVATDLDPDLMRREAGLAGLVEVGTSTIHERWSGIRFVPVP